MTVSHYGTCVVMIATMSNHHLLADEAAMAISTSKCMQAILHEEQPLPVRHAVWHWQGRHNWPPISQLSIIRLAAWIGTRHRPLCCLLSATKCNTCCTTTTSGLQGADACFEWQPAPMHIFCKIQVHSADSLLISFSAWPRAGQ